MKILVINSGSSSIKSQLINLDTKETIMKFNIDEVVDYNEALNKIFEKIDLEKIDAFAHRVVHGADLFAKSVIIDDEVIEKLDKIEYLAPLHNPHNLRAIKILKKLYPNKPQVAVFDTAFHHTMPPKAFMYALPYELYEHEKIRKYGFHGSSHAYLTKQCSSILNKNIDSLNIITLHLGNGCSACAIKNGKAVDTTMGFTPLEGLMMGTRSGDIDPSIVLYLNQKLDMNLQNISELLNKKSGLKGICKYSNMQEVIEASNKNDKYSQLALEMFVYKIAKIIGAYFIVLGKIDAIVFSGGIGQYSSIVREKICQEIKESMKIVLNKEANNKNQQIISSKSSSIELFVIPTDEQMYIALEAKSLLTKN
jgi:acetate kinase